MGNQWCPPLGLALALLAVCGSVSPLQAFHFRGAVYSLQRPPPPSSRECRGLECQTIDVILANSPTTTCPDGTTQSSCPVIDFDFSALDVHPLILTILVERDEIPVAVAGHLVRSSRPPRKGLGILHTVIVWVAPSTDEPTGQVWTVKGGDLLCESDCAFYAEVLNTGRIIELKGLDLSQVDLDEDILAVAEEAAAEGLLMVTGDVDLGDVLRATQILLPVAVADTALTEGN
jgi:hypothetical protein